MPAPIWLEDNDVHNAAADAFADKIRATYSGYQTKDVNGDGRPEKVWVEAKVTTDRKSNRIEGASQNCKNEEDCNQPGYADIICWNCNGKINVWEVKKAGPEERKGIKDNGRYVRKLRAQEERRAAAEGRPAREVSAGKDLPGVVGFQTASGKTGAAWSSTKAPGAGVVAYERLDNKDSGAVRSDTVTDNVMAGAIGIIVGVAVVAAPALAVGAITAAVQSEYALAG
jgi:hypothetical protein